MTQSASSAIDAPLPLAHGTSKRDLKLIQSTVEVVNWAKTVVEKSVPKSTP